jgi:membrane protease YdiL (CAAX protease family)
LKDAARILTYFAATLLLGAFVAPILFWSAQRLATNSAFAFLRQYEFETFFHRALMISSLALLWPLLRSLRIRSWQDLGLAQNRHWLRDLLAGIFFAAIPLLCCGALFVRLHVYSLRETISFSALGSVLLTSIIVPVIEEFFFRGVILGVLLRNGPRLMSILSTSAFFSILHFLKPPDEATTHVDWASGFVSIANSFSQFGQPMLLAAAFTTLFLLGWILADSRVRTQSLWLPIGLHAGWIFANGAFNKFVHRETLALPWLGKNLLVGIAPLIVGLLTWVVLRLWLNYANARRI